MKFSKKLTIVAAAAVAASVASCNKGAEKVHITVGVQQDTGNNYLSMVNFLNGVKDELNFEFDTVLMDSRNDAKNLDALQNSLNSGTRGIINMTDMSANNLSTLLKNLEANNAYYAGYMVDLTNAKNGNLLSNKRIVGSVTDGEGGASRGESLFNEVVKTNNRKIVFAQFPEAYFPAVTGAVARFKELAAEYNETHDDKFSYYETSLGANYPETSTFQMTFQMSQVPAAEYAAWDDANVDAVVAVNSLAKRILPAAKTDSTPINIFSVGFDDEILDDFGENKVIKSLAQTQAESIFYPLVQVLNAINGKEYSDAPTNDEEKILTGHYVYLTNTADYEAGKANTMNFSADHGFDKTLIDAKTVKSLLAGEENASFAKLKATLDSWTSEYVLYRNTK